MRWVFDLDGTLVDNRQAITEAYRLAGVERVPFSISWRDFCTPAQHAEKARHYPAMLERYARPTLLFERLWTIWNDRGTHLWLKPKCLTGASPRAVDQVQDLPLFRDLWKIVDITCGMSPYHKADWLAEHGWGIYVDDDADARRIIQERTTWNTLDPEQARLRLLSSPQEPTHGSKVFFRLA